MMIFGTGVVEIIDGVPKHFPSQFVCWGSVTSETITLDGDKLVYEYTKTNPVSN